MDAQRRFAEGSWATDSPLRQAREAVERFAGELAKPNGKVFVAPSAPKVNDLATNAGSL